ncbi:hypothetical protein ACJX0J_036178, partial [Zea mays]
TVERASPPRLNLNNIATQHEPRPVGHAGYHDDLDAAVAAHPPVYAPQLQAG